MNIKGYCYKHEKGKGGINTIAKDKNTEDVVMSNGNGGLRTGSQFLMMNGYRG